MRRTNEVKSERQRNALIRDLERLQFELPQLITAVRSGDEGKTNEAAVLLTHGSSGRFEFLMNKLTDAVIAECEKGNYRPLQMVASGEVFH